MKHPHQAKRRFDLHGENRASSELARDINRDILLDLLRMKQPIARVELARLSGLQRSTVSLIVEELIEEKWAVEGAVVRTSRGRRPTMLSLNPDLLLLVADVRPTQVTLGVVDLHGRFLSREVITTRSDAVAGVERMAEGFLRLRAQHPHKTFEGVGISLAGRVDPVTQRLILAPNLKWIGYDIKGALEARLGLQVEMENAANACLLSELWFGGRQHLNNAAVITISEGVGAAILSNGQLVTGRSGLAGEFGHIVVDTSGPLCACGRNGCWEMFASSRAALRFHAELAPGRSATTMPELIRRAEEGEPEALEALGRQAVHIGRGLRMITAALSPDVILMVGDITACWSRVEPIIRAELETELLAGKPPSLLSIADAEGARLRGAAALLLQRHAGYHRSTTPTRNPRASVGSARSAQADGKGVPVP